MSVVDEQVIGRSGPITLEVVAEAGRRLVRFTRPELAEELGTKPIRLGRFIASLVQHGIFEAAGGTYYALGPPLGGDLFLPREAEWDAQPEPEPAEPEPIPEPEPQRATTMPGRFTKEEARDWARALGPFTTNRLAREAEVTWATAKSRIDELVKEGILVEHRDRADSGRAQYGLRGEVPERRLPAKRMSVEQELLAKNPNIHVQNRGMEVVTQGAPKPSNNKDVNDLVAIAYAAGWEIIPRAKHWGIKPPVGDIIGVPSTPSSGGVRRLRDELRRAGLPALGDPNSSGPERVDRGAVVDGTSRTSRRAVADKSVAGRRRPGRRGKK